MKFLKKNKIILLSLLLIINIAIRFPVTTHAIGVDTFTIFALAESISTFGYIKWIIDPASFFGVYPYSYPSALMIIYSGVSQTTGISIEYIILIFGIIFGICSVFFMFLLAKEVWNNDTYAFLAAFAFSLSPNFLRFTYWEATTRNIFMALFPLFLWILLKYRKSIKKLVFFSLIISIILAASHRMFFLLPIIPIVFFSVILLIYLSNKLKFGFFNNPNVLQVHVFYILAIISSILFLIQFSNIGPFNVKDYYSGFLFRGNDFFSSLFNMAADYTSKIGIIFFFFVLGFIVLIGKSNKKFNEMFVLFSVIAFLPLMGFETYSPTFIVPFFILLSTTGFMVFFNFLAKKKNVAYLSLSLFMLISILFVIFMFSHWNVNEYGMPESTYNSAQFIRLNANGTIISNNGDLAGKITSYSSKPTIPFGGPYANYQPPGYIIYGFIDKKGLDIHPINISKFSPSSETFWIDNNATNAKNEWAELMESYYWSEAAKSAFSKFDARLIIEESNNRQYYFGIWRYSRMFMSLDDSGNKVYENGKINMWSV